MLADSGAAVTSVQRNPSDLSDELPWQVGNVPSAVSVSALEGNVVSATGPAIVAFGKGADATVTVTHEYDFTPKKLETESEKL